MQEEIQLGALHLKASEIKDITVVKGITIVSGAGTINKKDVFDLILINLEDGTSMSQDELQDDAYNYINEIEKFAKKIGKLNSNYSVALMPTKEE